MNILGTSGLSRVAAWGTWTRRVMLGLLLLCGVADPLAGQTPQNQQRNRTQGEESSRQEERLLQEAESRLGRSVSKAEIVEQLRQSGMTRAQVRARLQQMGYDPSLADQYFDVIERGAEPPRGEPSADLLNTLGEIGIVLRGIQRDTLPGRADSLRVDSLAMDSLAVDSLAPGQLQVFGRSLFRRATSQFQPVSTGPVDPDYRLGPGDQVILILTGDVESAYTLDVTREGSVVIPDVGQVYVNGLTMRQLEDLLYARLGNVYSGISRGAGATAHFQVTLGRLRNIQAFIIGEVERPGAYQVSSVSTVFNALYEARGPNDNGSFRRIEVRRAGQVVRTIDLYDYLLHGDSRGDLRLEQGDVIFVPVAGPRVSVKGAVRRPAIFELRDGDDLKKVMAYAGGVEANALLRRVQIDRILAPDSRQPGVDRVLVDVDVQGLAASSDEQVPLRDGDIVQVFTVSTERRNRITLVGEVRRPGVYEWVPGTSLWNVIQRAEGVHERAYTPRAHIYRLNQDDGTRSLIRTPLLADADGRLLQDVPLADLDSVVIHSRAELRNPALVTIDGYVKNPGTYVLADGMTVRDLVLTAGGFIRGANMFEADVARQPDFSVQSDTTAIILHVALGEGSNYAGDLSADGGGVVAAAANGGRLGAELPEWLPREDEVTLQPGDHIFIRKAPGYELARSVKVTGEITSPGTYVLKTRQERLLDVLNRAGGLTREAYPAGLQVMREGKLVGTDLQRAIANPASRYNLVLQPGDSLYLPSLDPTVLVTGAVAYETRVLYEPGKDLDYYVSRAGGYTDVADRRRANVTFQDGERATVERLLLFFSDKPVPTPGSTVFVPSKPEGRAGFDWDQALSRTLSIISTTVTVLIAAKQL